MNEVKVQIKLNLPYFYGTETESFLFVKLPKILFADQRFTDLSSDSKLLYSLMLDRVTLSITNNWTDNEKRVYIIFTNEEASKLLGKSTRTITNLMQELDEKGIGLIERKKRGLGKPDLIYVKNVFFLMEENQTSSENVVVQHSEKAEIPQNTSVNLSTFQKELSTFQAEIPVDNSFPVQNVPLQNGNNFAYRVEDSSGQDTQKHRTIKTDITNTEKINTDLLRPTFPPSPTPTYPQPEPQTQAREDGWKDLPREEKEYLVHTELRKAFHQGQDALYCLLADCRTNYSKMEMLVNLLVGMEQREEAAAGFDDYSPQKFSYRAVKLYARALTDMLTAEKMIKTKDQYVNYSRVFEKLIPHIHYDEYELDIRLDEIVCCTTMAYRDANSESEIKFPVPYMKSCIWTVLCEGAIRVEANFQRMYS